MCFDSQHSVFTGCARQKSVKWPSEVLIVKETEQTKEN